MDKLLIDKKKLRKGLQNRGFTKIRGEGFSLDEMKKLMKRKDIRVLYELWGKTQPKPIAIMGSGATDDAKRFFKQLYTGIKKGASDVNKWLKDTKILSKVGKITEKAAPVVGWLVGEPALGKTVSEGAKQITPVLESVGYGKRPRGLRAGRPMRGNGTGGLNGSSVYGAVASAGSGKIKGGAKSTAYGMISAGGNRMKF